MKDYKISITLSDATNKQFHFTSTKKLYEFFSIENQFWVAANTKPSNTDSKSTYTNIYHYFNTVIVSLDRLELNFDATWDEQTIQHQVSSLIEQHRHHFNQNWIHSNNIIAEQLIECQAKWGGTAADAFVAFTLKKAISNLTDYHSFNGIMYAYEIANQDSDILKRRNSEKKSFNKIRDELEAKKDELTSHVNSFQNDINSWQEIKKLEWENWHKTNDKTLQDWSDSANNKNQSESSERRDSFINFMDGCKIRIQDLENTYQEKLRLEKPAEYWKKAAQKYGIQGGLWSLALLSLGILGIVYFRDFFNLWLKSKELNIQLNSLQGLALYGSILAIYAFLIRVLSRLTFSSFHLMRDAEEREQLTYVYLSLSKEQNVDDASRAIILQSLFSRTETGLLNNESGPTMPGLHEMIKSGTK